MPSPAVTAPSFALRIRIRAPLLAVAAASSGYALVAAYFSVRRHDQFRSGFDLANFDQVLWLLANGHEPLNTQYGLIFWGEHFAPAIALLTPLYVLGAGPEALLVLQALTMALVAPLLFALARAHGAAPWLAAIPALLWLLSPLTLIPNVNDFHHIPFAAPLIVGSVLALKHDRLVLFAVLGLLACAMKEDVSLIYVMLGALVALEGRRRLGAGISGIAAAIFVFAVAVFLPAFGSADFFAERFAGDRGETLGDVVVWIATHPLAAARDFAAPESIGLCLALLATTGGLCLLAPRWMLLGLPALAHNLLSDYRPQHGIWEHYHVPVAICFAIAAAVGVRRLAEMRPPLRLLAAVGVTLAVVLTPLGLLHAERSSGWNSQHTAAFGPPEARRDALALVPDDVPLAASTRVTPHLAHRRELYTLPLPFFGLEEVGSTWSEAELRRREMGVRWVVLDTKDRPLSVPRTPERVRALLPKEGFRKIFEEGTISVWVR